jgi:hypothetical protein
MRKSSVLVALPLSVLLLLCAQGAAQAQIECTSCSTAGCSVVTMTVNVPNQPPFKMTLPWIKNINVLTSMNNAASMSSKFTFSSANSCPWGAFVTTIQGYTPTGNAYWALYVNGEFSPVGPSTAILNWNDSFSWNVVSSSEIEADSKKAKSHQHLLYLAHKKATAVKN